MMQNIQPILFVYVVLFTLGCQGKSTADEIITGAAQADIYLPELQGKKLALMVNHTSLNGNVHLVDFLMANNIDIHKIFAVEHGFRGNYANGETFAGDVDPSSGIPIVSLYGNKKKPDAHDLQNIDLVVFDLQDVGCRFFTYTSSMFYLMEACAENHVPLMILDRPNPNGHYIDGPVLDLNLRSFVGLIPVPIVHGCTVGELALMINGENWLSNGLRCELKIVKVRNYSHRSSYGLPVKPSPNLPNARAIALYPSLCLFEATNISIGRGTSFPFQVIGYPDSTFGTFSFVPNDLPGVSMQTLHAGERCYGIDLRASDDQTTFTLGYFIEFFHKMNNPALFWKSKRWIDLLTGDQSFYHQINQGWSIDEIEASWQPGLEKYHEIRKKYLLYPDFQ